MLEDFINALNQTEIPPSSNMNERLSVIASIYTQISNRYEKSEANADKDDGTLEFQKTAATVIKILLNTDDDQKDSVQTILLNLL